MYLLNLPDPGYCNSDQKMTHDYLNDLNESQRLAVVNTEGPALVIAGAGAGKTRVLTYRIAHLLQKEVPAGKILALTFTNKAARSMKDRIARIVDPEIARYLWMGPFTRFCQDLRIEVHIWVTSQFYYI
jgi:DNA helicase-2/ATP-dependent DNA helicase PcrA